MTQEAKGQRRGRLRALLVDEQAPELDRVAKLLRTAGYDLQVNRVDTPAGVRAALATQDWDVLLGDPATPDLDIAAVLALVHAEGRDVPYLAFTGNPGRGGDGDSVEQTVVDALRAGACDVVHWARPDRLGPAVERAIRETLAREQQRRDRERSLVAERMSSVGTLAAGVAHEINNPLAAVMANLELALRTIAGLPSEMAEVAELSAELQDAHEAAYLVRQIVRDVKLFARPDEERAAPVDVRQVLDGAARMIWNEIRHRARLVKDYGDVPAVWSTEAQLGQVFLNVLISATQALPLGRAHENRIILVTRTDGEGRAVVEISDTGPGLAPEERARLFSPGLTTGPFGATGDLGLSISRRIVRDLGGEIELRSEPGSGTTVRMWLPPAQPRDLGLPAGSA